MDWMAWIASRHTLLVHLPVAAAILIPIPIIAAQRGGRGIRPWWNTCRYLAWAGVIGSILTLVSGFALGRVQGLLALGAYVGPATPGAGYLFRLHELGGAATLVLGMGCLRALYRKRQEHQGIGVVALLLGLLWAASAVLSAYSGSLLVGHGAAPALFLAPPQALTQAPAPAPPAPAAPVVAQTPADPEAKALLRLLDFTSLRPVQAEPLKSSAHGNRWIRVWITPGAADAYLAGQPLPAGTLVVMTTVADRWGRPGFAPGPLYGLEVGADGRSQLSFYWAQVPEEQRPEWGGAERVLWRGDAPGLRACQGCHAQGLAPLKDRSTVGIPRKPKPVSAPIE